MMDSSKEVKDVANVVPASDQSDNGNIGEDHGKKPVPLSMKILSVVIVSMIGFGGHWSSGVTGALKSTLKKVCSLSTLGIFLTCPGTSYLKHSICRP